MAFFDAFRDDGGPTRYNSLRTAVTVDVLEVGFIFAALILFLSWLLTVPGIRGWQNKVCHFIRTVIGIFVTVSIFLCNFGQDWEVATIKTKTPYKAGLSEPIKAKIGVKIGLRSVNITLLGQPEFQNVSYHVREQINYNERFDWSYNNWLIGKDGFGPQSSPINQAFRAAQRRGTPYPILWVAEYFTMDGGEVRWGRFHLQAGFYAHMLLWLAFPFWILAIIVFKFEGNYGVFFSMLTGLCHLLACIVMALLRNPTELKIHFEDDTLTFHWGWAFWLSILNGLLCLFTSLIVFVLDRKNPDLLDSLLGRFIAYDFDDYNPDDITVKSDSLEMENQCYRPRFNSTVALFKGYDNKAVNINETLNEVINEEDEKDEEDEVEAEEVKVKLNDATEQETNDSDSQSDPSGTEDGPESDGALVSKTSL